MRDHQSGNVLFLILIAVALFAALSYAVTTSTRSGSGDTKNENLQLKASEILQYSASLRTTVQRMVLSGISPDLIEIHGVNETVPCSTGTKYCVFGPNGGGAIVPKPKIDPDLDPYSVTYNYYGVADGWSVEHVGTSASDIILVRRFTYNNKGKEICEALNKGLGVPGSPPEITNYVANNFNATPGQMGACYQHYNAFYAYYYVLYEI